MEIEAATDVSAFVSLLAKAGSRALERGEALADGGMVTMKSVSDTVVHAQVQGTMKYRVTLRGSDSGSWSCDCPAAADGSFCKHCVAVLCVLIEPPGHSGTDAEPPNQQHSEAEQIAAHVRSLGSDALIEIVIDQASADPYLAHRLLAAAKAEAGEAIDLREWKKRVTAAFRGRGGFIEWRDAADWARGVHEMLDVLEVLLAAGNTLEVAALAEHAHRRAQSAVNRVDDSGGEIVHIMGTVREIHLAAAEAGAYSPKKLGKRLANLELSATLDTFHRSAIGYADVLGDEGLSAYRSAVEAAQAKLPSNADRWGPAFRVRQAQIAYAIAAVDPDLLIEVHTHEEQMGPTDYAELVELLITAGRFDEAEDWADQGLSLPAGNRNLDALRDLRATLMRRSGGSEEQVEELYWEEFLRRPGGSTVRDLLANCEDTTAIRRRVCEKLDAATEEIRARLLTDEVDEPFRPFGTPAARPGSVGAPVRYLQHGGSTFVSAAVIDVLVAIGEIERGWSTALEFGADSRWWADLVERRQNDHPTDAIDWAMVAAESEICRKGRQHYRRAVRHLRAAQLLATEHDGADDGPLSQRFEAGVRTIVDAHRNKPSLLDEFAKAGWPREAAG